MRVDRKTIDVLCARQGIGLKEMLREAGVSRNAFYSLARKESILPNSIERVAERLGVPVSEVLDHPLTPAEKLIALARKAGRIAASNEGSDPDNIRHTLLLLDEEPIDRLRRALLRGRQLTLR